MFTFMSGIAKSYIFEWGKFHHSEKPSTQSFTPLNKGSEGYFLSCYHFQYPQNLYLPFVSGYFACTQCIFPKYNKSGEYLDLDQEGTSQWVVKMWQICTLADKIPVLRCL